MPIVAPYLKPLTPPTLPITPKSPEADIIRLQEWLVVLCYDIGLDVNHASEARGAGIDGDFGNMTLTACRNFAHDMNFTYAGVDGAFWNRLTMGMQMAVNYRPKATSYGEAVAEVAMAYALQSPREARAERNGRSYGADNSGPWVDLFNRGTYAAWCNGATATIAEQACRALGIALPMETVINGNRLWVPNAVVEAKRTGRYLGGRAATPSAIKPGSYFFVPNLPGDPVSHRHIGIVESVKGGNLVTLEGNTNDDGTNEGIEFVRRTKRPIVSVDYALA